MIVYIFIIILIITGIIFIIDFKSKEPFDGQFPSIKQIDHPFYGRIIIYENPEDVICGLVSKGEIWEENYIEVFKEYYKPGTDMLDIGANIGLSSLAFHKKYPITGTVHFFEPQYHTMYCCSYNTRSMPKRKLYNFALTDVNRIMSFETVKNNVGGTGMRKEVDKSEIILGTPLDNFKFENPISFIKIDIEGGEVDAIKGALNTLSIHKPVLMIEIWSDENRLAVKELLEPLGYEKIKSFGADHIFVYVK